MVRLKVSDENKNILSGTAFQFHNGTIKRLWDSEYSLDGTTISIP